MADGTSREVGIGFDLDATPAITTIERLGVASETAAVAADKLATAGQRIGTSTTVAAGHVSELTRDILRLNALLNLAGSSSGSSAADRAASDAAATASALQRVSAETEKLIADRNTLAASTRALSDAESQGATGSRYLERSMGLMQIKALEMDVAFTKAAAKTKALADAMKIVAVAPPAAPPSPPPPPSPPSLPTAAATGLNNSYATLIARMDALVKASETVDLKNKDVGASLVTQAAGVRALAQGTGQLVAVQERFDKILANLNQRVRDQAAAGATATTSGRYLTREMGLAQVEALKMNAALDHPEVHQRHAHGLNLIQNALASMVGHAAGVPPVVDHIANSLGLLALGAGTTLAITAGLAAIALAYEIITRRSEEAKKAAEAFRESNEGLAARSRAQETERSLTGNKAFGTSIFGSIDIVGQTKEITEARRAFQGLQQELNSRETANVGIARFGAFNQNLLALRKELASGSISLETFNHDLTALDAAFPGMEREILRTRELGESYDEAAKAVARLQAAENSRRAEGRELVTKHGVPGTSFEQGGEDAVRLAQSRKDLADAEARANAAQTGGQLAVDALKHQQDATDDATAKWGIYVKATGDATLANTTFSDALNHQNAVAQQLLRTAEGEISANERTAKSIQLRAELSRGTGEIDKQRALNAAFGESDETLKVLAIRYDALNKKTADHERFQGADRASVDANTDALARQQIQAVRLAAEKARRGSVRDANQGATDAERAAKQEADLVGLTADAVARKRIEYRAVNDEIAVQVRLTKALADAGTNEADRAAAVARAEAQRRANAANQRRDLTGLDVGTSSTTETMRANREAIEAENAALANGAAARKGYEIDLRAQLELKKAQQIIDPSLRASREAEIEATRQAEQQHRVLSEAMQTAERRAKEIGRTIASTVSSALDALGQKGANFFQSWWDAGKKGLDKFIGDAVGSFAEQKFSEMMGIGPSAAATKQITAGATMLSAAQMQLLAANAMLAANGLPGIGGIGAAGSRGAGAAGVGAGASWGAVGLSIGAAATGGGLAGYNVGSSLYSQSHGAFGNYARGAIGGGLAGAGAGAAIGYGIGQLGGPITAVGGAVVGAFAGFVGGLLGMGNAAKEAAKQTAELRKQLELNMASFRAQVNHDDLGVAIAQADAERERRRREIEDAYAGGGSGSDTVRKRNELLAENTRLSDQYVEALRREAAERSRYFTEDLDVRALRAQGKDKAADDLAFKHQQDRELDDYRRTHDLTKPENAAQYAYLQQVQAWEAQRRATDANTKALNDLTTSVNTVTGFKLDDLKPYIQEFAQGRPYPGSVPINNLPIPVNPFVPPMSPLSQPTFSRGGSTTGTAAPMSITIAPGAIVVNESKTPKQTADEIMNAVLTKIAIQRNASGGLASSNSAALDQMKVRPGGIPWRS